MKKTCFFFPFHYPRHLLSLGSKLKVEHKLCFKDVSRIPKLSGFSVSSANKPRWGRGMYFANISIKWSVKVRLRLGEGVGEEGWGRCWAVGSELQLWCATPPSSREERVSSIVLLEEPPWPTRASWRAAAADEGDLNEGRSFKQKKTPGKTERCTLILMTACVRIPSHRGWSSQSLTSSSWLGEAFASSRRDENIRVETCTPV